MKPILVAVAGPLEGTRLTLADGESSIGRDESNRIVVDDLAASRRHCVLRGQSEQFTINDLSSRNGTFVNGLPVKERILAHRDEIKVGRSCFLFILGEEDHSDDSVEFDEGMTVTRGIAQLRSEDALYLQPDKVLQTLAPSARIARDLNALLKLSTSIHSTETLEALERRLLDWVFEVSPADRAALLLGGENNGDFTVALGLHRDAAPNRPVWVSPTVVGRVLREGISILSNDVQSDPGTARKPASDQPICSLMAVPLLHFQLVRGVLYLDSSNPNVQFDNNLLQLFTGVGAIAGLALENVRGLDRLENENRRLLAEINVEHDMVGQSSPMTEVYRFISKVAPTDSTVLITGESGTGKELVARAIHRNSPHRSAKPFVAINCAALTESLLESELFGHEKGAFTGAVAQKKGKFEVADGGTVFLDEIGELAPILQAKLLRVLQQHEVDRVGGTRPIKVDVRVLAATNRDIEAAVGNGNFRQDLFYRLNVISLRMPSLRERREDIAPLANYFAAKSSERSKRKITGISKEACAWLSQYDWPGNVRELENAIERAVVMGASDVILPEDLPETVLESESAESLPANKYHEAVQETKKRVICQALEQANGIYTEAAKLLGVHPNYLHRLIRQMNLKPDLKKVVKSG